MTDEEQLEYQAEPPEGAGQRLQMARRDAGLSVADVAKRTRIPERHLVSIENGEFNRLPAPTYAVGFSRTFARAVGLDEQAITQQVRAEVAALRPDKPERPDKFEPGDPDRVPSRRLAWFAAAAIVLLVAGVFTFYRTYFSPGLGPAPLTDERQVAVSEAAGADPALRQKPRTPARQTDGQVVFTALEDGVWARFYDAQDNRLLEKQLARGERFAVPQDVEGVQIWTGRPDAFAITVGGRPVPKLAEEQQIVRDVPVTAEALLAREGGGAAPAAPAARQPALPQ